MTKILHNPKKDIQSFCILSLMLLFSTLSWGQQVIGSFPYMNGGFEGQAAGALGTTLSSTVWTRQNETGASSSIVTTSPRTGVNYATVTNVAATSRGLQSPQLSPFVAANSPTASTAYIVQYWVKNAATVSTWTVSPNTNGTGGNSYPTAITLPINASWTKYTVARTSSSTAVTSAGIAVIGRSSVGTFNVDDVVIYPGTSADETVPNEPTSPAISSAAATQQTISWTAASGGVDGGGYMVVRSTADPATTPNANGIYAVGNFVAGTEKVVYLGTNTSFIDLGLSASTQYFYRIYTVDKAFNYSTTDVSVNGSTTAPSFAAEPTSQASGISFANVTSTSFDINWTAGSGTNSLVIVKEGSAVNANPSDGDTLSPDLAFGSGALLGTGNYVVYNSTSNSVSITGLLKARTYYVKVYTFNGSAGSENYLITSPPSNNQFTLPGEIVSSGLNTTSTSYSTGSTWVGGAAPTQYDNVTIVAGDIINLSSTQKCYNLTIETGGKIQATTSNILQIYGTSLTCNGTFGDASIVLPAASGTGSQLILEFGGNLTISGTGNIYPFRIRPVASLSNIGVTFDTNVTCTNTTAGVVFDNGGNDNVSLTVNAGKTVTIAGNFNSNLNSILVGAGNATINVFGTITIAGNLSPAVALGKTCTFTVKNGGLITADRFYLSPAHQVQAATYTVESGGKIEVNGPNSQAVDCSSTSFTSAVVGAGTFSTTSTAGLGVYLANASGLNATTGPIRTTTRTFDVNNTFNFAGIAAQETGGYLPATVGNLTINNPEGVTLGANTTVNGLLTLTSGIFSKGSSAITLGSLATIVRTAGSLDAAPTFGSTVNVRYNGATAISSGVEIPTATSVLKDLTIATTASAVVTLASATSLNNKLTVTTGSLATGGNLTLKSAECCTAFVGQLAAGAVTGDVTVERYIPAKRAWRALTAPLKGSVSDASIFSQWQNNGATVANTGVELWGPGGDTTPSSSNSGLAIGPNSSMLQYVSGAWSGVTNTNSTKLFTTNGNNAFMLFPTGSYGSGLISSSATPLATTLKATGKLIIGNVDYTGLSNTSHTLIGNPYASPIDLNSILDANTSLEKYFWVWDPNGTNFGTYNTFDATLNTYSVTNVSYANSTVIQSGQAFFVKALSGQSGSFTITESNKSALTTSTVFKTINTDPELIRVNLHKQENNEWLLRDATLAGFFIDAEANQTANKLANVTENIAFTKNGNYFASEHHLPLVSTDTLNVRIWKTTAGANYKLKINTEQFTTTGLDATLQDMFTNSNTPLSLDGTAVEYPFTVTSDATSSGDRFRIVFSPTLGTHNFATSSIKISPNPIIGDSFQVSLGSLSSGNYDYFITNSIGQEIGKGSIMHNEQAGSNTVKMQENVAAGIYIVKIIGTDKSVYTTKLIKQ